jgi:Ca2+-transporting ATPase
LLFLLKLGGKKLFPDVIATKTIRLIPGRLRIAVDNLRKNPNFAEYLGNKLQTITGIKSVATSPLTGRALIYFNQEQLTLLQIKEAIDQAYQAFQQEQLARKKLTLRQEQISTTTPMSRPKFIKGDVVAPKIQVFTTVVTGGILAGIAIKRLIMGRSTLSSSQQIFNLAALTTIVSGYPILRRGIAHLVETKKMNHDLLISIATLILLAMRESITGLSILWLIQLSGLFNYVMQVRSRRAIDEMLVGKQPAARRISHGREELIAAKKIAVGDIVVVHRGERVSVDGEVVDGKAIVNQAAICADYLPDVKGIGDRIVAGTMVETGTLKIKALKVGNDTNIAHIVAMVEKAATERGGVQSGEIYSMKLVPWAIGIAGAILLLTRDFQRSLAVLLAGCPMAVALSSNTSLGMSVAQAAGQGILVKDARVLEIAEQTDVVLFDKTGTLTSARPQIGDVVVLNKNFSQEQILILAAAAEKSMSHPLAQTLAAEAKSRQLILPAAVSEVVIGHGVRSVVGEYNVCVGNELLMAQEKIDTNLGKVKALRMQHLGNSPIYVAVNRKLVGIISIRDVLRSQSKNAIEYLRTAGIEQIGIITGDNAYAAETVSGELGVLQSWSAMLPDDKVKVVTDYRRLGSKVIMVGDGINDSPAIAAANIGVAMTCAAKEAIESADIIITGDDPRKVAGIIGISKKTMQVMRQNLAFSVGMNAIGIALAVMRITSPITAILLQNISTVGVLLNSSRLLAKKSITMPPKMIKPKISVDHLDLQQFSQKTPDNISFIRSGTEARPTGILAEQQLSCKGGAWNSASLDHVCSQLHTSMHFGISGQEAKVRQSLYGLNVLAEGKKDSFWQLFRNQFKDFMVKVLLGAAGISFVLGKAKHSMLTVGIVIGNALLGAAQEIKAEESLGALQKLGAPQAKVIRSGRVIAIKAEQVVPGDLIVLEAGDKVPADARIVTAVHFEVEEASLTGETIPSKKNHLSNGNENTILGDRKNMVFMGTSVTRGRGTAIVVATGMATEMGKIAMLIQQHKAEPTPLQCKLEELAKVLAYGCLAISGLVFLMGVFRGENLLNMLQIAASLAVAAIPEGLTAIVVIALAMGVQRMAKRNIIVRKMGSIETLGCANVICSDKTGTLTKNEMTVRKIYAGGKFYHVSGDGYIPRGKFYYKDIAFEPAGDGALMQTLLIGVLCNNAKLTNDKEAHRGQVLPFDKQDRKRGIQGDPTEGALLVAAGKAGLWWDKLAQSYIRIKENPFESEKRMMSVICTHQGEAGKTLYCKGAPDSVLEVCTHYLQEGKILPLNPEAKQVISKASEQMASEALRVLATAYRDLSNNEDIGNDGDEIELEQQMIFCGLTGMIDPPRQEVPAAIKKCKKAGVKVVMITGDHPNTAKAIARDLGLLDNGGMVVLGQEIDQMSDKQLANIVARVNVYARTAPQHKLRIIKALKEKGYVVAMTGDGVNDAPAVKAADIGIAMGIMGTDVTKEAASMILSDDNFATIVLAIEEGRAIYANIRKAIRYLLATNIGEVVLMIMAIMVGLPMPLLPIQLLWINLIGDGLPAIALVNDPPAKDIMQHKPRSAQDSVFSGGLGRKVLARGLIMGSISLALYAWKLMTSGNYVAASTLVLAQVAVSQFFHIFDCRIEKQTGKVNLLSNWPLIGAVGLSMVLLAGVIHIPGLQSMFGTMSLGMVDWLLVFAVAGLTSVIDAGVEKIMDRLSKHEHTLAPCRPAPMPVV